MINHLLLRKKPWFIALAGLFVVVIAYLVLSGLTRPFAPSVVIVTSCGQPRAGTRRIGYGDGVQFDVPTEDFDIHEGVEDAPPFSRGFDLRPKNGGDSPNLDLSWGTETGRRIPEPQGLGFTAAVERRVVIDDKGHRVGEAEKRVILDKKGHRIGTDEWGYWSNGERWREVRLVDQVVAVYGHSTPLPKDIPTHFMAVPVHKKDAEMFDRVLSSVCVAPTSNH